MATDLSAATNKNKAVLLGCVTLFAAAMTVASTVPAEAVEESSVQPEVPCEEYVIPESDYEIVTDARVVTWARFQDLRREWREMRGARSSVAEMVMLPAYQKIMGMGRSVLPHILAQLQSEGDQPDHWFWALAAIADDNPVPAESRGKVREMAKAWLEWGEKAGHVHLG